jgi:hypothetical protein
MDVMERFQLRQPPIGVHFPACMRVYRFLPLSLIERYEELARNRGVSKVARSPRGFLTAYRAANGRAGHLTDAWKRRREAFIARHLAQMEQRGEPVLEANGQPTRRHLALIMWAFSPKPSLL